MRLAPIALVFLIAALPAAAAPGGLDPTFSGNGWVRTYEVSGARPYFPKGAEDVAIRPTGRSSRSASCRTPTATGGSASGAGSRTASYNANGSIDSSFGSSGAARAAFPGSRCGCELHDLAVQRNGRIVAVGQRFRGSDAQDDDPRAVARFLPNGQLDRSFSGDGRFSRDFGYGDDFGSSVAIQRDGKIVVGGVASFRYRSEADFAVVRLRPNGRLDRTFSGDGVKTVNFRGHRYDDLNGLDLQRDGHIVAAGSSTADFKGADPKIAVLRLNRDGTLDRRFGRRLTEPGPHGGYARAILADRSGRILVGGRAYDDSSHDASAWALVSYRSSGALDRSFGKGGIVLGDFGTGADWIGALAEQPDGKVIAAGEVYRDQALARYLAR